MITMIITTIITIMLTEALTATAAVMQRENGEPIVEAMIKDLETKLLLASGSFPQP